MKYPKREKFYAHRLTRLLFKSCAAQSIGQDAVLLVIHIAHTEDAARYQGPVRFWNSQLNEVLGFRSPKSLNNARHKAIQAGWLVYERPNDRADGRYWTEIPSHVALFDDEPIEPVSIPSTEQEREQKPSYLGRNGNGKRNRKVTGNDPLPNPVPVPKENTRKRYSFDPLSAEIPVGLQSEFFRSAWSDWVTHRAEIGKPLKSTSCKQQLKQFSAWGQSRSVAAMTFTIAQGWQGIREPDAASVSCVQPKASPKLVGKGKPLFDEGAA